ncbi:unnamed protein product [Cylindrotheca closterium]|uniref:Glycosyltransferase 61 catalytic domain-containing protein n=1 Tax=Cylindrotheca closterium TaxID=2856 RepID=A0AAD2FKD0_9STRA|nr:unnamed protein product [Cylindrotheca closterium]
MAQPLSKAYTASDNQTLTTNKLNDITQQKSETINYDLSVAGLGKRRSHSTHYCLGPRQIEAPQRTKVRMYRSCHFTDVCFAPDGHPLYKASNTEFQGFRLIYITKDGDNSDYVQNPELIKTIIKPQGLMGGPSHMFPKRKFYTTPRIINESTAALHERFWSPIPVAIPFLPHQCTNFGHALGDNAFAIFRILQNFGLYHPELDFLPMRIECADEDACLDQCSCFDRCKVLSKVMAPFLKDGDKLTAFQYYFKTAMNMSTAHYRQRREKQSLPLLCFENVLSGMYYYADHGEDPTLHGGKENENGSNLFLVGKGDKVREFRNQYMIRLGLDPNRHLQRPCASRDSASIVVIPRRPETSRQSGWYDEKLIAELQKILPDEKVAVDDYSTYTVKAQVELISKAKVLVSMGGGASYLAWFLGPGASALFLKRRCKVNDGFIWDNLPYIRKEYFNATDCTAVPEVFDYAEMAKSVAGLIQHYNRRFCED